jgi:Kef-type K+ transport system membrane component KefB
MIAGVCLGPSLLGLFYPELQSLLFPWQKGVPSTQSYLYPASQLGLALYMFIVGMEFRLDIVASQWRKRGFSFTGWDAQPIPSWGWAGSVLSFIHIAVSEKFISVGICDISGSIDVHYSISDAGSDHPL